MEKKKINDILLYLTGGVLATLTVGGAYFILKRLSKPKLSQWLEDYLTEVEEMIKNNKGVDLSAMIIGHVYQLITEVEEHLYLSDHSDLEEDRVAMMNSPNDYRALFVETMEVREEYYKKATDIVEKRLNLSISNLDEMLRKYDIKEAKEALRTAKKPYDKLPDVSKQTVREAFIYYVKEKKKNERIKDQEVYMMSMNPEYKNTAMANIFFIKNKLRDDIKAKYNLDEKYFDQLLDKYDLLNDSEVRYYQEEMKTLD